MISHSYYETIHKICLPGVWSKGVSLSKTSGIILDRNQNGEISLRVRSQDRPVSHKVSLWVEEEDWYCDCGDRNEICAHIAAAVIFLKALKSHPTTPLSPTSPSPNTSQSTPPTKRRSHTEIEYEFYSIQDALGLRRWILYGETQKELLKEPLTSIAGGISSGRIQAPHLSVTQDEYRVDAFLRPQENKPLDPDSLQSLFKILSECTNLIFEGSPVSISSQTYVYTYQVLPEKDGYTIRLKEDQTVTHVFSNGILLQNTTFKGIEKNSWTLHRKLFQNHKDLRFAMKDLIPFLRDVLPELQKTAKVEILTSELPQLILTSPEISLNTTTLEGSNDLFVTPEFKKKNTSSLSPEGRPILYYTDPFEEKALARKLQNELQLSLGQTSRLSGDNAIEFCLKAKSWNLNGKGASAFQLHSDLQGALEFQDDQLQLVFKTPSGENSAQPENVLRAWRENARYVKLLNGGWAPLPENWLSLYGERIEALLQAKESTGKLPRHFLPEVIEICDEQDQAYPDSLKQLKDALFHSETLPLAPLPSDLRADLRHYQREGVNWLCFLRNAQMGAMLADDMGLGKTLQTLCAIQGKTLIIAPTSVLMNWQSQIQTFRPELKVCTYSGTQRKLDLQADVILTSYGIIRLDREEFIHHTWDTVVLDEAQTIKNPESQISKVIHQIQGTFKIALSGTPIENQLEDLWSQFQFLNPGLLGSRDSFQDHFITPILRGDLTTAQKLQNRIKPFILRRLKRDVLPELPAKTEVVLYSELNNQENEIYQSLLLSTRKEVVTRLEQGGGIFGALELLLRLRQACCSPSLIPGQPHHSSSKIDLLLQTLEKSIAFGHRALVFSQWTSYLDLIEREMQNRKIQFSRLDGGTPNRKAIVEEFQSPHGPSVMLISLKAGGTGLTLTAADHVFIMDPWWNPAIEDQAADRTHRIGQKNPVWVHRLIAQNTIEEKIHALQKAKAQLSQNILEDTGVAASLSREDILELLR